jgi:hypothetical protein
VVDAGAALASFLGVFGWFLCGRDGRRRQWSIRGGFWSMLAVFSMTGLNGGGVVHSFPPACVQQGSCCALCRRRSSV